MEHREIPMLDRLSYPVGTNISENLSRINMMADLILQEFGAMGINLWCRGSSGAIIAAIIASYYHNNGGSVRICHVKKKGERSHSGNGCPRQEFRNIIVDDFSESGETVLEIHKVQQQMTDNKFLDAIVLTDETESIRRFMAGKVNLVISQ